MDGSTIITAIAAGWAGCAVFGIWCAWRAPEGWEDDEGWHGGRPTIRDRIITHAAERFEDGW